MPGKEIDQVVSSKLMYLLAGNSLPVSDVRCPNINIITLLYIKTLISKESNKMRIYYSYRCRDTWTDCIFIIRVLIPRTGWICMRMLIISAA